MDCPYLVFDLSYHRVAVLSHPSGSESPRLPPLPGPSGAPGPARLLHRPWLWLALPRLASDAESGRDERRCASATRPARQGPVPRTLPDKETIRDASQCTGIFSRVTRVTCPASDASLSRIQPGATHSILTTQPPPLHAPLVRVWLSDGGCFLDRLGARPGLVHGPRSRYRPDKPRERADSDSDGS